MKWRDWIQSLGFVTQSAHFFAGMAIVLGFSLYLPYWAAMALLFAWAFTKEMIFDWAPWGEGHGSPDFLDFVFYMLGGNLAFVLIKFSL